MAFRQKLCYPYLYQSANKKILQIHFEFAYFSFFLTNLQLKRWIRSYTPVIPSKTISDSRPKWAKCIPVFRPKRRKNPTRWGGTYLYNLYKGVPLPPGSLSMSIESKYISNVFLYLRSLRKEGYTQAEIDYLFQSLVIANLTYGLPSTALLVLSLPGGTLLCKL